MKTVGIICGGGLYPFLVAESCLKKKIDFCLLFLNDFQDDFNWPDVPKLSVTFGEVGKALDFLRDNNVDTLVFAGCVKRPRLNQLSLDKTGAVWLAKLGKAFVFGNDTILRAITELFQKEGMELISGTELMEDPFFEKGVVSVAKPSKSDYIDIKKGFAIAKKLGLADVGQAVAVFHEKLLGSEGEGGTSKLIKIASSLRNSDSGGVFVKVSKPQQDFRFDLPAIGVDTIEHIHKGRFSGIAVEYSTCIVLDKKKVVEKANEYGLFIVAFDEDFLNDAAS